MTSGVNKIYPKDLFWREKGLNRLFLVAIISLLLMATLRADAAGEISGETTDLGHNTFIWDCENFAGFYYDLDSDICTEKISFYLSDISEDKSWAIISEPYGVKYETHTAPENFEFESWGRYNIIGLWARGTSLNTWTRRILIMISSTTNPETRMCSQTNRFSRS